MFSKEIKLFHSMFIFVSLSAFAQKVENVHFEQVGKQIIIHYDLTSAQTGRTYDVQVFYSSDDGKTFSGPMQKITGAVGKNINSGINKQITWDVIEERGELVGEVLFEVQVKSIINTLLVTDYNKDPNLLTFKLTKENKRNQQMEE